MSLDTKFHEEATISFYDKMMDFGLRIMIPLVSIRDFDTDVVWDTTQSELHACLTPILDAVEDLSKRQIYYLTEVQLRLEPLLERCLNPHGPIIFSRSRWLLRRKFWHVAAHWWKKTYENEAYGASDPRCRRQWLYIMKKAEARMASVLENWEEIASGIKRNLDPFFKKHPDAQRDYMHYVPPSMPYHIACKFCNRRTCGPCGATMEL